MLMAVFVVCDIVHSVKLCQLLQVVNASFIVKSVNFCGIFVALA